MVLTCLNPFLMLSGPSFWNLFASFIVHLDLFVNPGKHFIKICEDPRRSLIFLPVVSPASTTAQTPGSHASQSPNSSLIPAHEGTSWISLWRRGMGEDSVTLIVSVCSPRCLPSKDTRSYLFFIPSNLNLKDWKEQSSTIYTKCWNWARMIAK